MLWPDIFLLRVLIYPCICMVVFSNSGHVRVLGCQVVGVFSHLGHAVHVGTIENFTVALSSIVAGLENASSILIRFLYQ